jgi:CPA1 family monovalent cation:H+ antiporter
MELDLVTVVLLLAALLLAASLISLFARRFGVPYTVVLVVFGFGLRVVFSEWEGFGVLESDIATEVVFFIFLPTLLFESSFNLDSKILFKNIVPVLIQAIPAFLLSVAIVGFLAQSALGLSLATALLFGALISATDPVAVVALFKELGAPKRLVVLVEGESLLNDATAIVLFNVLLGIATGAVVGISVGGAVLNFVLVFTGGIAVGAAIAFLFANILGMVRNDELVEITLTTIVAYMSFIVAEHYLHVSGVMATATAGIILGGWGRTKISPSVSTFMHEFWEYLAFAANSLIFLLVGMALSPPLIRASLFALLIAIPIVYFARGVSIAVAVPLVNATKKIEPIDRRYQLVMFWGGLRGALALALALSLPNDFAAKETILVASMGVVMATLLVNALTLAPLLRWLGFDRLSPAELFARFESLLLLKRDTRANIQEFAAERAIAPHVVDRVRTNYLESEERIEQEREASLSAEGQLSARDRVQILAQQVLQAEKRHYWTEFSGGQLREQAYKQLIQDVDYQTDHVKAFKELPLIFEQAGARESPIDRVLYRLGVFSSYLQSRKISQMADRFEQYSAKTAASRSVLKLLDRLRREETIDQSAYDTVHSYYQHAFEGAQESLAVMGSDYPEYVERTQEYLLTRRCLQNEERTLEMVRRLGLVPDKVYLEQKGDIEEAFEKLRTRPVDTLQLDAKSLLAQIPLFQLCNKDGIARIAELMESESFAEGDRVVRQGESGDSMYVVARGSVKVVLEVEGEPPNLLAVLCAGGFFGEIALLTASPRTATVLAATPGTLLRLRRENLRELLDLSPELRDDVNRAYKERVAAIETMGKKSQDKGKVSPA